MVHYLKCAFQNYAWGKKGFDSEVACLIHKSYDTDIKEQEPYAELWMGTHPKAPSEILSYQKRNKPIKVLLSEYIETDFKILGSNIIDKYKNKGLPFLFKVLSIRIALSIQAHPNKALAEVLHQKDPKNYPDDNHKPEMAIAITPMQALCGFKPMKEIIRNIKDFPDLINLIGSDSYDNLKQNLTADNGSQKLALKNCFTAFMEIEATAIEICLKAILAKLNDKYGPRLSEVIENENDNILIPKLIHRLNEQFPGDIGCLSVVFLNFINLLPGKAVFLGQDEPHAYLQGDCMECMACSDNVVRAGLTPKYKDVSVLCDMLTYQTGPASDKMIEAKPLSWYEANICQGNSGEDLKHEYGPRKHSKLLSKDISTYVEGFVTEYQPPVQEFAVQKIEINNRDMGLLRLDYGIKEKSVIQLNMPIVDSASIMIIIRGFAQFSIATKNNNGDSINFTPAKQGLVDTTCSPNHLNELHEGSIIFMDANEQVTIHIPMTFEICEKNSGNDVNFQSYFLAFRAYTPPLK